MAPSRPNSPTPPLTHSHTHTSTSCNNSSHPSLSHHSTTPSLTQCIITLLSLYSLITSVLLVYLHSPESLSTHYLTHTLTQLSSTTNTDTHSHSLTPPRARALSALTPSHTHSTHQNWIFQHIIGPKNLPPSSTKINQIFPKTNGFNTHKACMGPNKTLCNSSLFQYSKNMDTLHGDQLFYVPYELGKKPLSVDQICQVSE